jgi:hypothetical protein
MHRTPAYWPARILLAVGVLATVMAIGLATVLATMPGPMFTPRPDILGLPQSLVAAAIGVAPAIVGLIWMIRIFRGPRDVPPAWRHRDR